MTRRPSGTERAPRLVAAVMVAFTVVALPYTPTLLQAGAQGTDAARTAWFCPMHPDVTSEEAGKCRKCGMAFVSGHPFDARDYQLEVATVPTAVRAGEPFRMTIRVGRPDSGDTVKDFEVVHDKRYHLFVVSHDLTSFQHIHPELDANGSWVIDVTVPKPGYYRVLSDFLPAGGSPQFLGRTLVTAGFDGDLGSQAARLEPDTQFTKTVASITANLAFEPSALTAGQYGHLQFTLSDAATGQPVTDLQPYLGAFGHTLILSEDLLDAVHSHPSEWVAGEVTPDRLGGPRVTFEGYMPRPGRYRAWTQFLRRGELVTVSFTFTVWTLDDAVRLQRTGASLGEPTTSEAPPQTAERRTARLHLASGSVFLPRSTTRARTVRAPGGPRLRGAEKT